MRDERRLFEKWFIKTEAYKLISEMNYFKMDLFYFIEGRGVNRHSSVQIAFMVWTEFAKREGFVLVPVEPTERVLDTSRDRQWDDMSLPFEDISLLSLKSEEELAWLHTKLASKFSDNTVLMQKLEQLEGKKYNAGITYK